MSWAERLSEDLRKGTGAFSRRLVLKSFAVVTNGSWLTFLFSVRKAQALHRRRSGRSGPPLRSLHHPCVILILFCSRRLTNLQTTPRKRNFGSSQTVTPTSSPKKIKVEPGTRPSSPTKVIGYVVSILCVARLLTCVLTVNILGPDVGRVGRIRRGSPHWLRAHQASLHG